MKTFCTIAILVFNLSAYSQDPLLDSLIQNTSEYISWIENHEELRISELTEYEEGFHSSYHIFTIDTEILIIRGSLTDDFVAIDFEYVFKNDSLILSNDSHASRTEKHWMEEQEDEYEASEPEYNSSEIYYLNGEAQFEFFEDSMIPEEELEEIMHEEYGNFRILEHTDAVKIKEIFELR